MNIDWSKAPEWANFVAMDYDGCWWFFEGKPRLYGGTWYSEEGKHQKLILHVLNHEESLQQRPSNES